MQTVELWTRKTWGYIDGWDREDQWDYLTRIKMTPPKITRVSRDYDQGATYVQFARLPATVDTVQVQRAVEQTLGGSRCQHDYDCCGCATRRVFTRMIGSRRMLIHTSISYNY